jgi:hypothetical protein
MAMARGFDLKYVPKIIEVCQTMEKALFEYGPPSMARWLALIMLVGWCVISALLLKLAMEHHGVAGFASAGLIMTMPDRASLPVESDISGCENEDAHLANFGDSLNKFRQLFMALPEDIRFELLVFFLNASARRLGSRGLRLPVGWNPCLAIIIASCSAQALTSLVFMPARMLTGIMTASSGYSSQSKTETTVTTFPLLPRKLLMKTLSMEKASLASRKLLPITKDNS